MKKMFILILSFLLNLSFVVEAFCDPLEGDSVFHIESTWKDQHGKEFQLRKFVGRSSILAMVYTSCLHACPMIVSDMLRIRKGLTEKQREKVRFVLVSLDPERDTPSVLAKFAKKRRLGENWSLITADEISVRELAAVLGVKYKKKKNDDIDHSNIIHLLNSSGVILHQQKGLRQDPAELLRAINRSVKFWPVLKQ